MSASFELMTLTEMSCHTNKLHQQHFHQHISISLCITYTHDTNFFLSLLQSRSLFSCAFLSHLVPQSGKPSANGKNFHFVLCFLEKLPHRRPSAQCLMRKQKLRVNMLLIHCVHDISCTETTLWRDRAVLSKQC